MIRMVKDDSDDGHQEDNGQGYLLEKMSGDVDCLGNPRIQMLTTWDPGIKAIFYGFEEG